MLSGMETIATSQWTYRRESAAAAISKSHEWRQ